MQQQQISLDEIVREQLYSTIISQRDSTIISLINQMGELQKEIESLKKKIKNGTLEDTGSN